MLCKEIEALQKRLNALVLSDNVQYDAILKVSQELDILLVRHLLCQVGKIPA